MTPQFEDACIAAATLMAADQGWSDPTTVAIAAFGSFRQSEYALGEGMEGDQSASAEDAQNFVDWWESLSGEQKEVACIGEDITGLDDDVNTIFSEDTGAIVVVSNDNHAILNALFVCLE